MVFQISGSERQQEIIRTAAYMRCDFPWHRLIPGLKAQVRRDYIPVEWADLSRYAAEFGGAPADDHDHDHAHDHSAGEFDVLAYRGAVLGLAWYSGKISIEQSLVNRPTLAMEVFLSEGAHMVDFFYMNNKQRVRVWNAFHPPEQRIPLDVNIVDGVPVGHGHGWFDVGGYRAFVGEALMGGFVRAFSDLPVSIPFDHPATEEAAREIRQALLDEQQWYFGQKNSRVFHDSHKRIRHEVEWPTTQAAIEAGRRPCKTCKPMR